MGNYKNLIIIATILIVMMGAMSFYLSKMDNKDDNHMHHSPAEHAAME